MLDEVRAVLPTFTDRYEGKLFHPYLDVLGLVTTGRGNLIDPMPLAIPLPWQVDGAPATSAVIVAEWQYVKSLQQFRKNGGRFFEHLTKLRLTPDAVDALCVSKWVQLETELLKRPEFFGFPSAPAPAQLGTLSMCWAMGADFHFPHFQAAFAAQDWATCAGPDGDANADLSCRGEAWMRDGVPGQLKPNENLGLRPRNLMNKRLFTAARDGVDLSTVLA